MDFFRFSSISPKFCKNSELESKLESLARYCFLVYHAATRSVLALYFLRFSMDKLRPPPPFSFEGNVSHGWKTWQKHFQFFLTATESDSKSDKIKTSILLTCIGPKGRDIYETFTFKQDTDKLKLKSVIEKFMSYCNPRKNITILRQIFHLQASRRTML